MAGEENLRGLLFSPLFGLTVTLVVYLSAFWLYHRCRANPLVNPVLVSVALLVTILLVTEIRYETYFAGAQFIHFFLGPATVALAIPLYQHYERLKSMFWPILMGLVAGSLTAVFSAVFMARWMGASTITQLSLAPKSVTTPIAMGVAERIGGIPSLTAVLVILTGILGAVGARYVFNTLNIRDEAIRGFSMGVASHGIGTARAFQINAKKGAFAALAMGLNGALTAVLLPLIQRWL